jgi:hypothetical protein
MARVAPAIRSAAAIALCGRACAYGLAVNEDVSRSMGITNRCVGSNVLGTGATRFRTATGRLTPLR